MGEDPSWVVSDFSSPSLKTVVRVVLMWEFKDTVKLAQQQHSDPGTEPLP